MKIMVCIIALSLFAAFDEIHQMYVPGRNGNWVGFSFDVMGIVAGLSVMVGKGRRAELARRKSGGDRGREGTEEKSVEC